MNCAQARRAIGAAPGREDAELREHLRECAACAEFHREMCALEERIRRALQIDLAARQVDPPAPQRVRTSLPRMWAMAAGIVLAIAVGVVLWAVRPGDSLAGDLVAHVAAEPQSWNGPALPASALAVVLRDAGVRMDMDERPIVFAQSCLFRGRLVPHFVVSTPDGPVTVMILPDERVHGIERFSEGGYSGVLLPAGRGTMAVLVQGSGDAESLARDLQRRLHWTNADA